LDLFSTVKIELQAPIRKNKNDKERFEPVFRKCRERIETFSPGSGNSSCLKEAMLILYRD